ncbi:MAG: LPS export ABC transporter protein LptC [Sulfurimonas sp.]|jgi:LPS export ABC transporter protein LptC|uniref:LPS export ABC transporter periplasmic protein LptC n=1 Tax=Sulfurimonas sp. TaxID=2022749 RepID=UPI0039E4E76F
MNINIFFTSIIGGLFVIFFLFEPLNIKKQDFGEIPVFELEKFKLIELNEKGLTTVMDGVKGVRYTDRYIVYNINYTDNTKKYLANMTADEGLYEGDIIDLTGNIKYSREDGISFSTQEAVYNRKTNIVTSPGKYIAYLGKNKVTGSTIEYSNVLDTITSKQVTVNYKLKERK